MGKLFHVARGAAFVWLLASFLIPSSVAASRTGDFAAFPFDRYGDNYQTLVLPDSAAGQSLAASDFWLLKPFVYTDPLAHADDRYVTGSLHPFDGIELPRLPAVEPFGLKTSELSRGAIVRKWKDVRKRLSHEQDIVSRCRAEPASCPTAAKAFLVIVDRAVAAHGWTQIAEINRAINLDIKPVADIDQYGVIDFWATPLMVFASHAGDCEDYAIAKYAALQQIGVSDDDLRLVVVHDQATREDHAVTAVRYDGHWLILDNRTLAIRQDVDVAQLQPLFVLDDAGVRSVVATPSTAVKVQPAATARYGSKPAR